MLGEFTSMVLVFVVVLLCGDTVPILTALVLVVVLTEPFRVRSLRWRHYHCTWYMYNCAGVQVGVQL